MSESEYKKQLLLHKISSHRRLFRVEADSAKAAVHAATSILSLGRQLANVANWVSAESKTDSDGSNDFRKTLNLATLLTIALSVLASLVRTKTED